MRALGLDIGERRIGLAIGDSGSRLAIPVGAIIRSDIYEDIEHLLSAAQSRNVDVLVVGMPWSLNGKSGPQAKLTLAFVETLRQQTSLVIETWDERFTSVEADKRMRDIQRPPGRRRRQRPAGSAQDALAATIMLQAFLDADGS